MIGLVHQIHSFEAENEPNEGEDMVEASLSLCGGGNIWSFVRKFEQDNFTFNTVEAAKLLSKSGIGQWTSEHDDGEDHTDDYPDSASEPELRWFIADLSYKLICEAQDGDRAEGSCHPDVNALGHEGELDYEGWPWVALGLPHEV